MHLRNICKIYKYINACVKYKIVHTQDTFVMYKYNPIKDKFVSEKVYMVWTED